jgi:signal transduction histidine kinase
VEIQATILANALERSSIRPLPLAPALCIGAVCALALFVWPVTGERLNLALNLGLVVALLAAALVLFRSHRFLDFLPVLTVLFFTYLAHLFRQLLWAAGRILGEVRRLARELDAGLQQVCTSIPARFIRAPARDRSLTVASIQRHLDRLQAAINALSLQHHFLDDLLKKELPPLILWERTSGRPIFANTAFVDFWRRFTGDAAASLPASDTFRAAIGSHPAEADPDAAPAGADPASACVDVEVRDDSGLRRHLQVRRHRLQATDVPFSGTLAVFQDVTELKELERVKDEVVSIVSHELKLPLTTILGYGEMLAMTLDGAPRQYAGEICAQTRRLNRMIEDFLDIARLESGRQRVRRAPFPPGRMLEDAIAGVAPRSGAKDIDIVLERPERTSPLIGDESLLLQAVLNLLDNGVKFSPAHTTMTLGLVEEPEQFVITVADQGPGIPAAERQAVFDKFQRGTQTGGAEGFGLGLHLVRQIIGLHGGTIEAVEAKVGACFRLTLPKRSDSEMAEVRSGEGKTGVEEDGGG